MPLDRYVGRNALSAIIDALIAKDIEVDTYNLINQNNIFDTDILDDLYINRKNYDAVIVLDLGHVFDYRIHKHNYECPVVLIARDDPQNFEYRTSFISKLKKGFRYLVATPKDRDFFGNSVVAKQYDAVFTHQQNMIERYHSAGVTNVHWLPYWCDTNIYSVNKTITKEYDVATVMHPQLRRKETLDRLEKETSFTFKNGVGNYNQDCSDFYQKGKMVFNMSNHGEMTMRIPEALGTNSFLLTDKIDQSYGLEDLYTPGEDFVYYSDYDDLIQKVAYYKDLPQEREQIALNALQKTLKLHTQESRANQILSVIKQVDKSKEVDVSINIISYGRPLLLKLTLESLKLSLKGCDLKVEVILLDQNSDVLTKSIIKEHYDFIDQVVFLKDNVGISEAWNLMYALSSGKTILPIENDWFCNSKNANWLSHAYEILESDPALAFVKLRKLHDRQMGYGRLDSEPWTVKPFPSDVITIKQLPSDGSAYYITESAYSCFTFNPVLMKRIFRNEFADYYKDDPDNVTPLRSGEDLPSKMWRRQYQWKSAALTKGPFVHMGFYRSIEFFKYLGPILFKHYINIWRNKI